MNHLKEKKGFTLVELLVAVGLMALIMTIVGLIFKQTTRVYSESEDRMTIYLNARNALDMLEVDLLGCLPLDINLQKFSLDQGVYYPTTTDPLNPPTTPSRTSEKNDLDSITFRTFTSAGGEFRGVEISYILGEETDPTILAETGGTGKTLRTKRQLYALYRYPREINKDGTTGKLIGQKAQMALCHYVLSFNVEYFDTTRKQFREVDDHLKDSPTLRDLFDWPIGDNNPAGEQLHRGLRTVLRVVANAAERQERIFPRAIWIPVGY